MNTTLYILDLELKRILENVNMLVSEGESILELCETYYKINKSKRNINNKKQIKNIMNYIYDSNKTILNIH